MIQRLKDDMLIIVFYSVAIFGGILGLALLAASIIQGGLV